MGVLVIVTNVFTCVDVTLSTGRLRVAPGLAAPAQSPGSGWPHGDASSFVPGSRP